MSDVRKKPPEVSSEDEERKFRVSADSTEFADWQASLRTKFLRLTVSMIEDLKILANRRDVPYQSLLKVFLAEWLAIERRSRTE